MANKTITKEQLKAYIQQLDEYRENQLNDYIESVSETLHDPTKWGKNNQLNADSIPPGTPPPPPPPPGS